MPETVNYIPILVLFVFVLAIGGGMLLLPRLIGRRKPTPVKSMAYECGKDPIGSPRERFTITFYLVAMVFILFDIEAIFVIPWAVVFKDLANDPDLPKGFVLAEMMIFILILLVGYAYVWRKGTFDWNR